MMTLARKTKPTETPERIIRDPEFAKRLNNACDASGHCPPLHKGRLTWVQTELKRNFKEKISVETVRKWFAGEAKPRPEKVSMLAELLQVDISWLSLGVAKRGLTLEVTEIPEDVIDRGTNRGGVV